jgi:hypothetical protein
MVFSTQSERHDAKIEELLGEVFPMRPVPRLYVYNEGQMRLQNPNIHLIGQGEPRHRKYKRLKLGGGQAYDRSCV